MGGETKSEARVVIIGAGMAGLCCALELQSKGIPSVVLDAAGAPGGRVRTDKVEGFLLDRGFQVLLTAYPEARRVLDYKALGLRSFLPGALVRTGGRFHLVADPFRRPWSAVSSLRARVGSLQDKLLIARLRSHVLKGSPEEIWTRPETSTAEALRGFGFSERMIDSFFRPFFGGIFLETELASSSRLFEFVFRMFSVGRAALPSGGMGAISAQLTGRLAPGTLRLNAKVASVGDGEVVLERGERLRAAAVVVATDSTEAARLLPELHPPGWHGTACLYYAADKDPVGKPVLVLNGEGSGPIDNLCVPSTVAPSYAPAAGKALVSVSVTGAGEAGERELETEVCKHLSDWFGPQVSDWKHLRTYRIPRALPARRSLEPAALPVRRRPGLYICGDHRETPSLQGAMASGRRAAEAVVADRGDL
jgi:phytoene dehydrogenase-like protein